MSENTNEPVTNTDITGIAAEAADQTESAPETASEEKTRPSVVLALSVLVGGWALTGEDFVALIHSDLLGWLAIAIAIAIGVALVAVPTRRGRS